MDYHRFQSKVSHDSEIKAGGGAPPAPCMLVQIFEVGVISAALPINMQSIDSKKTVKRPRTNIFLRFPWISFFFGSPVNDIEMAVETPPGTPTTLVSQTTDQIDRLPSVNQIIISEKSKKRYRLVSVLGAGG